MKDNSNMDHYLVRFRTHFSITASTAQYISSDPYETVQFDVRKEDVEDLLDRMRNGIPTVFKPKKFSVHGKK